MNVPILGKCRFRLLLNCSENIGFTNVQKKLKLVLDSIRKLIFRRDHFLQGLKLHTVWIMLIFVEYFDQEYYGAT